MKKIKKIFSNPNFYIPIGSIILGLLVGSIVVLLLGRNPIVVFGTIIQAMGLTGELNNLGEVLMALTPLILTGMSVGFAFRTGLFNIGAEGQFITGRFFTFIIAYFLAKSGIPPVLLIILSLLIGSLAGGLWGAIPGYLKAKHGVHEVIVTIMMNWIALFLSLTIVSENLREARGDAKTEQIPEFLRLHNQSLTDLFGADIHIGIFIALAMTVIIFILLFKTTIGFELRAVGYSPKAAEYAGMNVNKNIVLAMTIAGALSGLAGGIHVLGVDPYRIVAEDIMPGYGFNGIAVSLIGNNHPFGIILGALMMGILEISRNLLQVGPKYPKDLISVIIAVIIYFYAANGLIKYIVKKIQKSLEKKKEKNENKKEGES